MSNSENPQNSRRSMLQKTILTSTAITLGLLGFSNESKATRKTSSINKKGTNVITDPDPTKWETV
ncbi:hypothetical protein SAMN05216490_3235 [Mucilaginibacter mallensis]|uniref:Uncharacterized protein n=1 Tax=Mucilaginibacter mallensis TaxID=652787 RepID=A0A1H1ZT16_MUCMA|nr:hypothetical protein SAMN05216490_3235 [Mucilaginibacter mallensis]